MAASGNPLSDQQRHAVDCVANAVRQRSQECMLLQAVAGSGKSTTLVAMARAVPEARVLLLAFNVQMAAALRARTAGTTADVFTLHSYGLHLLRRGGEPPPDVEPNKMYRVATALLQRPPLPAEWRVLRNAVDERRHRGETPDFTSEPRPLSLPLAVLERMLAERDVVDQEPRGRRARKKK